MRTVVFFLIASFALASLAFADEQRKTDRKGDLKGVADESRGFDLKSASVVHVGRDTFRHRVTSWNAGGISTVALEIASEVGSRPSHFVRKPRGKKAGIYMYTRRGAKRVAGARFKKHSRKSFSFTIDMEFAGLPPKYGWRWVIPNPDAFGQYVDRLPNRGLVTHDISAGHDD